MNILLSLLAGVLFGVGLIVAGMANPSKVLGFLDFAGTWDPSLALAMAGGIGVGVVAFSLAKKRTFSLLGLPMEMPSSRELDGRLIGGSVLFGIGWGLAGICPGPALVLLGAGAPQGFLFFAALLAGMWLFELLERRKPARLTEPL
jgi:uncharacterized membrane protein YedE/YeeE